MSTKKSYKSFAQEFAALEKMVHDMQQNNCDVEQSLATFEEALRVATHLKKILETAELKVVALKKRYSITTDSEDQHL